MAYKLYKCGFFFSIMNQVRKVNYRHIPAAADELTLIIGDFIYLNEEEIKSSQDEWYKGVSWLTGCCGMFPGPYTERVAETETWTMHRYDFINLASFFLIYESNVTGNCH